MKFQTALILGLLLFTSSQLFSQKMDKVEKKKWTAMAKDFKKNPESLKRFVEDRDLYKQQAQEAEGQLRSLQNSLDQERRKTAQLEQNVTRLNNDLMKAQEANYQLTNQLDALRNDPPTPTSSDGGGDVVFGLVYRVQVGAFSKGRIPQKIQNLGDLTVEEEGNVTKVLVGNYETLSDARARAKQLRGDNIKGAFVVPFKDGFRISIEEAKKY